MFTPLLVTSSYSFHFGTAAPRDIARRAKSLGYPALGLSDRGVYGIPTYIEACGEQGIRPVLGTEILTPGGRALLIARTQAGWSRLSRLLTRKALGGFDAPAALLSEARGGACIPGVGEIPDLYIASDDPGILAQARGGLYALLLPSNRSAWRVLSATGAPPLASGEVRFLSPGDRRLQRLLIAIGSGRTVPEVLEKEVSPDSAVLESPEKARRAYADAPGAAAANEALVESVEFSSVFDGFVFPKHPTEHPGGAIGLLRELVYKEAARRYGGIDDKVRDRIEYELSIIDGKGFADYFLVVRDIVRKASRTCGRGSAAASIVAYVLGITDVEPLAHGLYFARFLNPGRKDPPDIDVDFAWDERDAVLASVIESFGEERAARVANHVCFQARSALHETARAYGMSEGEISDMERSLAVDRESALLEADAVWKEILELAPRIVGFPRHLGVHSGGLIVVPDSLAGRVPLESSGSGIRVTVWDKEGVEAAGLVKIDLLGNRSLAVVRDALGNLRENGTPLDEGRWKPLEDAETEAALARGDTMGVFYVESPAMRLLQRKTGMGDFAHLVIHSSIIRPAANRYISEYIDRLKGKPYTSLHPLLDDLFSETYGILCYQEDVSKAAEALAGFSPAEADGIRKVLSKKDVKERLDSYRALFEEGARRKGVDSATIEAVWRMIESFSGYSFVKAHSASYAMLSFRSAYLRVHHPAEFMAAVISNHGGFYSTLAYASEARRMGLSLLPPDVNASSVRCRGSGFSIRFGLGMIASLGEAASEAIWEERERNGPFASTEDFGRRVRPGRTEAESLVGSGALDSLCGEQGRPRSLMRLLSLAGSLEETRSKGPELFSDARQAFGARKPKPISRRKFLEAQFRYLGTTLEESPLALWPEALSRPRSLGRELPNLVGRSVTLVGLPITAKPILTSNSLPMEFVSFEDETALFETVLFPEQYKRYRQLLFNQEPLSIRGRVENDHGAVTVAILSLGKLSERA